MMWPAASARSAAAASSLPPKGEDATESVTMPMEWVVWLLRDRATWFGS